MFGYTSKLDKNTHEHILLIIGRNEAKKTTFIERLATGQFLPGYTTTLGVTTHLIRHYNLITEIS